MSAASSVSCQGLPVFAGQLASFTIRDQMSFVATFSLPLFFVIVFTKMCFCQPANAKTAKELREERDCPHVMPKSPSWTFYCPFSLRSE